MDLVFKFIGVDAGAGREFDKMALKADATRTAISRFTFGAAAAGATVAAASIKMAGDFQTAMTRIHTQANQSNKTVAALSKGVLNMAGTVAETPTTLADAAYHIASIGQNSLTTAQQLRILKIATEGAKIGGADLVDVTNALDAAIVSGIKGAGNYSKAMGVLNATVGAGDMRMQDLADAFGPLSAVLKGYNVDLKQAGAALAVFGDNNHRGAEAGTALRMAVQSLAVPVKAGQDQLQAWGIKAGNLSKQLQHGGLTEALDVLMAKMRENGVTAKTQGDVLTQTFGKRAGVGLNILMGELDRYHTKLDEVGKGATGFAAAWQGYTKTFGYAWDSAKSSAQALFIQLGTKLLPTATRFMNWVSKDAIPGLEKFAHWLKENAAWTKPLAIGLAAAGAAAMVAFGGPVAIIAGIAAIAGGLVIAYKKSQTFREVVQTALIMVKGAFDGLKTAAIVVWHALDAVWHGINGGVQWLKAGFADFTAFWKSHSQEIGQVTRKAWTVISTTIKVAWQAAMAFIRPALTVLKAAFKTAFDLIKNVVSTGFHVVAAIFKTWERTTLDFVGVILDIITGHWGKAWADAKKFVSDAFNGIKSIFSSFAKGALHLLYQAGKDIIQGLINGVESMAKSAGNAVVGVGKSIVHGVTSFFGIHSPSTLFHYYGQMLAQGLINGWTGEAGRLKSALSTPVQNALNHFESVVKSALSKQSALVKSAQHTLNSDLSSRRADIASLAGTVGQGADLSNLFGTDANGAPTVANLGTFLGSQVGPLQQFAKDEAWAKAHHLNKVALGQIANLGAVQGDQVLKQLISGQTSIATANRDYALIGKYSKAAATTAEDALYAGTLARDRANVTRQNHILDRLDHHLNRIEREAGREVARHVTIETSGKGLKLTREDAREIARALRELDHNIGIKVQKKKP